MTWRSGPKDETWAADTVKPELHKFVKTSGVFQAHLAGDPGAL